MKTVEEIYSYLVNIKNEASKMNEDSFDKTKAFKFVYNHILDLIDELNFIDEENELFDDDNFDRKPIITQKKKEDNDLSTTGKIDLDDLI